MGTRCLFDLGFWDLGFGIWDFGNTLLGFGIWEHAVFIFGIWEHGIWDLGFGIWNLGFGIWDLGTNFGIWENAVFILVCRLKCPLNLSPEQRKVSSKILE